jgi:hypothetical protein
MMYQCSNCDYMNGDKPLTELHILRVHTKLKPRQIDAEIFNGKIKEVKYIDIDDQNRIYEVIKT